MVLYIGTNPLGFWDVDFYFIDQRTLMAVFILISKIEMQIKSCTNDKAEYKYGITTAKQFHRRA